MLIVFGITLKKDKKLCYALPELYGIGLVTARRIAYELGLSPNLKLKDLTEEQQYQIIKKIKDDYCLETNLQEKIKKNIQRYIMNGSLRGFRHKHKLPVRGQRTHTNGKTARRVIFGIPMKMNKKN
jgi:small subunit ribosomal protein S13